jgi:cell cycle arrest protein BUB2
MSSPPAQVYDTILALLTPTASWSRHRSHSEVSDGLKRIRRIVLTEGIPEVVSRVGCRVVKTGKGRVVAADPDARDRDG